MQQCEVTSIVCEKNLCPLYDGEEVDFISGSRKPQTVSGGDSVASFLKQRCETLRNIMVEIEPYQLCAIEQ